MCIVHARKDVMLEHSAGCRTEGPYSHDLALVRVRRKTGGLGVTFSSAVAPICLPSPRQHVEEATKCVISGWGKTARE